MSRILLLFLLSFATRTAAQVGIGTSNPDASAKLHVEAGDKGFLPPRVALTSTTDVTTILTPAAGLLVYNTANTGSSPGNVTPGYYYYNGTSWSRLSTAASLDGLSDAKSGGDEFLSSLLIGSRSTGTLSAANYNTGLGISVFGSLTTADANSAFGFGALNFLTTGCCNNAVGYMALTENTTGQSNIAMGKDALTMNSSGNDNVGLGRSSLQNNKTGSRNVSLGSYSMLLSSSANDNIAIGQQALYSMYLGSRNVAVGSYAVYNNQSSDNVGVGFNSMRYSFGSHNTSLGSYSLYGSNPATNNGSYNSASGYQSLYANTTGSSNAAFGKGALYTNTTGSNNTALGADADVTTSALTNATAIGYNAKVAASNTIQLGNTSVTSINTSASVNAAAFNVSSDARLKDNIQSLDHGLETVMRLKPYRYEKRRQEQSNAQGSPEYGFLAQDVSDFLPEIIGRSNDPDGTLNLNYTALIPILARAIQEQQKTIVELNNRIDLLNRDKIVVRTGKSSKERRQIRDKAFRF